MASETATQITKLDIVTQFEMARAQYLGRKRIYMVLFWMAFFVSMTLVVWHSGCVYARQSLYLLLL